MERAAPKIKRHGTEVSEKLRDIAWKRSPAGISPPMYLFDAARELDAASDAYIAEQSVANLKALNGQWAKATKLLRAETDEPNVA